MISGLNFKFAHVHVYTREAVFGGYLDLHKPLIANSLIQHWTLERRIRTGKNNLAICHRKGEVYHQALPSRSHYFHRFPTAVPPTKLPGTLVVRGWIAQAVV